MSYSFMLQAEADRELGAREATPEAGPCTSPQSPPIAHRGADVEWTSTLGEPDETYDRDHIDRCYSVAREVIKRVVPSHAVDDVTQETMLRYWRRGRLLPTARSLRWVARVAWNVSRAWHREHVRAMRGRVDAEVLEAIPADAPIPDEDRSELPPTDEMPDLLRWIEDNVELPVHKKGFSAATSATGNRSRLSRGGSE